MEVRALEPGDYAGLGTFTCPRGNKAARKVERDIRYRLIEEYEQNDRMGVLVAVDGEKVIGVIAYRPTLVEDIWEVPTLACHADHTREGVATELKRRAIEEAQALGASTVVSYVHRINLPMLKMNEKLNAEIETDPSDGEWRICTIVPED